ncbi:MAG: hypothetical protein CSA11_05160 [Chloroflexi bacterium]|nr:MAG: hypothetical protein CSA11_05160 [Chloroflexota bacterium]
MKNRQHLMILLSLLLVFVLALAACGGEPAAEEPVEESSPAEAGEPVAERVETGTTTPEATGKATTTATPTATATFEPTETPEPTTTPTPEPTETPEPTATPEVESRKKVFIESELTEEERAYLEERWNEGKVIQIIGLAKESLRIDNPPFGTELGKFLRGEDSSMYPDDIDILLVKLNKNQRNLIPWEGDLHGIAKMHDQSGHFIDLTSTIVFNLEENDVMGKIVTLYDALSIYGEYGLDFIMIPDPGYFKLNLNAQVEQFEEQEQDNEQAEQVEEQGENQEQDNEQAEQVEDQEHGNEQAEQEQSQEQSEEPAHQSITP